MYKSRVMFRRMDHPIHGSPWKSESEIWKGEDIKTSMKDRTDDAQQVSKPSYCWLDWKKQAVFPRSSTRKIPVKCFISAWVPSKIPPLTDFGTSAPCSSLASRGWGDGVVSYVTRVARAAFWCSPLGKVEVIQVPGLQVSMITGCIMLCFSKPSLGSPWK